MEILNQIQEHLEWLSHLFTCPVPRISSLGRENGIQKQRNAHSAVPFSHSINPHNFTSMLASTAVRAIVPKTASKTVLVGGGAYISQSSISLHQTHRHYATAKKPSKALPGAMTFTDALAVIKVLHQRFTRHSPTNG